MDETICSLDLEASAVSQLIIALHREQVFAQCGEAVNTPGFVAPCCALGKGATSGTRELESSKESSVLGKTL